MGPTTTARYYHQDGLGSVIGFSTQAGSTGAIQRFDAWGNKTAGTGTVPQYGYVDREPDVTGFIYYRARYYDPSTGRFTQRDPIDLAGGINLYAYALGNPVSFIDPSGLVANAVGAWTWGVGNNYFAATNDLGPFNERPEVFPSGFTNLIPGAQASADTMAHLQAGNFGPAALSALAMTGEVGLAFLGGSSLATRGTAVAGETALAAKGGLPAKVFSTKAPTQVTPGVTKLAGQHIDDLGRVQPWKASYDNFGRLIERTDWNAANSAFNINATHHHIFQYLPKGQVNSINHIPGVGPLTTW